MTRPRVVLTQPIHAFGRELLAGECEVIVAPDPSAATVIKLMPGTVGVIVRTAPFTEPLMAAAGSLRVIARHGVGVDNIDVAAATKRGVLVANTPNANASSVAEHTVMLMLALARRITVYDRATRSGHFEIRNSLDTSDLGGKTLGLIGAGRIGRLVAGICRAAFGMRVIAYDPYLGPDAKPGPELELRSSLEEVLSEADVVSLHIPLTRETEGMVGRRELALMRPGALLINAARGGIVDEDALCEALSSKRLAGAGLDVFREEPPDPASPLLTLDNAILTPHCAALTRECAERMAVQAAQAVLDFLAGRRPEGVVNPEVLASKMIAIRVTRFLRHIRSAFSRIS